MTFRKRLRRWLRRVPRVNVLRLYGPIGMPGRGGASLSDEAAASAIESAFSGRPTAVALAVNSPGGSPVQSSLIAARIRRLADERDVPVFAFCEDVAASGGYWLACAADEIWADRASILGSIGVLSAGFGAHEAIARLGIERRVHSAGPRKAMLDPFQPEKPEDLEDLREIHAEVHHAFIAHVRARRGDRLTHDDPFTGAVWVGQRAVDAGLADGIGHLGAVMRERYGDEVALRSYGMRRGLLQRFGLAGAAGLAEDAAGALEARLLWARYGL